MLATLIALFGPMAIETFRDVTKAVTNKYVGLSIDDQVKLDDSTIRKNEALAKLDNPYGTPSQWVVDLRASFRYIAAGVSILVGSFTVIYAFTHVTDNLTAAAVAAVGVDLIGIPFAFIFGDRLAINIKNFKK